MDFYTTKHISAIFKISLQSVKNWAIEFAPYLSPTATPQEGKKRLFTVDDLKVFALVHEYRERGYTYEEAHGALRTGQRGDIPASSRELIPTAPAELITALRADISALEQRLREVDTERIEYKGQVELLKEQLKEQLAQSRLAERELIEEIALLKAQLKHQGK